MSLKQEQEANEFAACFLMPEGFILKALRKLEKTESADSVVRKMADRFGVTESAMRGRLVNLGILTTTTLCIAVKLKNFMNYLR